MKILNDTIQNIALEIRTGKTPPTSNPEYFREEINWYTPSDLDKEKFLGKSRRGISKKAIDDKKAIVYKPNTVLIGAIGDIGKLGVTSNYSSSNQQITGIYPDPEKVDAQFLYYWLKAHKQTLLDKSKSAIVPILNNKDLGQVKISFPELISDQLHIANLLSKAENLIAQRKESIRLLDEFLKSTFLEMFGDISGEKVPLASACILNPKKSEISEIDKTTEVSFIPMANVSEKGEVNLSQTRTLESVWNGFTFFREDDVVFAKITPCMENGKGAIMKNLKNKIGFGTTEFHVLRPIDGISTSAWLYHLTTQDSFRKKAEQNMTGSAGQKRVPTDYFERYKVIIPPIKLQTQFAEIVEKSEAIKTQYQQSLQELENLYGSLSQKAFKGKLFANVVK